MWCIITSGSLSERFPVRRSGFFDELRLFLVGLIDSKRFPPWRQQTGSGFPEWCAKWSEPTGPASDIKQALKNYVSGKKLPV